MKFLIAEFDNDYHTVSKRFFKPFSNKREADDWCKKNTWSGESYYIIDCLHDKEDNNG